jgi:putative SOS response-associated peptidase YedK
MCNAYTVTPKINAQELDLAISAEAAKLPSTLVRRLGTGLVVVSDGGDLRPQIMRWGFPHQEHKSVNNARSESLRRGMWVEPMESRRCLVPISTFFEWQELSKKAKQPYEFRVPQQHWMWVAGLYGDTEEAGLCYATITTEPPPKVVPIHDRLLAIMNFDEGLAFLRGEKSTFSPYEGPLQMDPCDSPLIVKKPPAKESQMRLF